MTIKQRDRERCAVVKQAIKSIVGFDAQDNGQLSSLRLTVDEWRSVHAVLAAALAEDEKEGE